jgi:dTMP kinase
VIFTEWNSSSFVKKATQRGKKKRLLTPTTFSLIHCTDFADRYDRQILPLLLAGYLVLSDRYVYTLMARDIVRGISRDWVRGVYSIALVPYAVFYLDVTPKTLAERNLRKRGILDFWKSGMDIRRSGDMYECFIDY